MASLSGLILHLCEFHATVHLVFFFLTVFPCFETFEGRVVTSKVCSRFIVFKHIILANTDIGTLDWPQKDNVL